MAADIRFLSVDDVLAIHEDTIRVEGGLGGVRSSGLLDSAVTMARQRFGGKHLHPDLASMAAAYLFHIVQNHPFHDGNKRTGAMAALIFLSVNGARKLPGPKSLERTTLAVASGQMSKTDLIDRLRKEIR